MTTISGRSQTGRYDGAGRAEQPANWRPEWRQFPVLRKTSERPRSPLASLERRPEYWRGYQLDWQTWLDTVTRQGLDVALVPRLSGLVVLDCDVKRYAGELVVAPDNPRARSLGETTTKRGIDDLVALVRELGRDPAELATYAVATPSGGVHLYYDVSGLEQARRTALRTRHHRDEWRIDVIASVNSWVAAPPTPGYQVVRDLPVAPLPDWLHEVVVNINALRGPVGGPRRRELTRRALVLRAGAVPVRSERGLLAQYLRLQAELVRLANRAGAWNSTIFEVACDLFALGLARASVEELLVDAAEPWDERQLGSVLATIGSAQAYKLTQLNRGA